MTNLKILAEDEFWRFSLYEEVNCFRTDWQAGKFIEDEVFQSKMEEIVEQAKVLRPSGFLANTLDFNYTITPEMQEWHNNLLFPVFEEIGLKKMALIVPADLFAQVSIEQAYDEKLKWQMQFFDDEQKAYDWIVS